MTTVFDAIRGRRSIRNFVPGTTIPQEHIENMLTAAMMAPSGGNSRPWEFIVIENKDVLGKIPGIHPYSKSIVTASLGIVVCARPEAQTGKLAGLWPQDCGAAIQNILLQAYDLGYGTCWCAIYPSDDRVKGFQALLKTDSLPVALISVGVANESPEARGYYDASRVKYIK